MRIRFRIHAVLVIILCLAPLIAGCSKNPAGGDEVVDDGTAPTSITDLAVAGFSDTSVTLTWTASGDDAMTGTADSYDLRMSAAAIHWSNFDSASQVTGLPAPKPAGETERFVVLGLETDSTYYFSLRVTDENGNFEGASNCVNATCFNDFAVNIPDAHLLAVIRDRVSKPTGDILKSDLLGLLDLNAADQSIVDLTGLEYCANLTMLNIINNSVSDLSPLTRLDKLVQLHAGQNAISDLTPLVSLFNMNWLRLNSNQIVSISPLSGLMLLTDLDLQGNQISDISPTTSLVELQNVNLSSNRIEDIGSLVANTGFGDGDHISLNLNPLVHESINTHIPTLRARGVTVHWIENTIPPGNVLDLAVDTVSATSVTLSWTAPGEDFYEGSAYRYELRYSTDQNEVADWSGGQLASSIPAPDTSGTTQSVVVSGLTDGTIYYFALRTQDNSENWSGVSNVVWAQPYSDIIVTFNDAALETAIRSALSKPTGDIYKSELSSLDTLFADNQGISDLTGLEHCVNLTHVHLIDNNISMVDQLSGLIGLYDLNLQGNNIADVAPLASLSNLGILQLTGNPVGSLSALSSLHQLWYLSIMFIGVTDLTPLSSLTELRYLFIFGNGISDISPLSNCSHLNYLYADHNNIASCEALSGLLELNTLSLNSNLIQDISPLVSNLGLASGDQVALEENPLSSVSINTHIPALQARGVTVTF